MATTDIRDTDILVIDEVDYPIHSLERLTWNGPSDCLSVVMTNTLSVKRPASVSSDGLRAGPTTTIATGIKCTSPSPLDPKKTVGIFPKLPFVPKEVLVEGPNSDFFKIVVKAQQ